MSVSALITNISRGSLHDGPGIRTVVYFKGCGLRCQWCHNPETLSFQPQILFSSTKCIGCGKCVTVCPNHHLFQDGRIVFQREDCSGCGRCADCCPANALCLAGEHMTVEQVMKEVEKDRHFYAMSGGGVTFSGGECLLYPEFVAAAAKACRKLGIHTAVETALFVPWENIACVQEQIDLFFVDLKLADEEKHKEYTGQSQKKILDNLRTLVKTGANVIIRIPLIPHVNDTADNMWEFAGIIRTLEGTVCGVELLKYNYLAESKYALLDMKYTAFALESQTEEYVEELGRVLEIALQGKCSVIV